jgi:hypothetical protein
LSPCSPHRESARWLGALVSTIEHLESREIGWPSSLSVRAGSPLILCPMNPEVWAARRWLLACAIVSVAMVALFPGSYYEDAAIHFLRARWMWSHAWMAVDVWDRPVFTLLYSIPANLPGSGFVAYVAAKVATVVISLVTAWLTWDLARAYRLERPALVIPLMWLQPCVFILSSQTTPELLFALLLVVALRLRQAGRVVTGLIVASLLMLVRPEGFALLPMWIWWGVTDARSPYSKAGRLATILALGVAPALWWYLSAQITLDPLFPIHNWPPLFKPLGSIFLGGGIDGDTGRWNQVMGVALVVPALIGVWVALRRRETAFVTGLVLLVFGAHLVAGATGIFGWAPIPAEAACVAPALALVTLAGWDSIARIFAVVGRPLLVTIAVIILSVAMVDDFALADAMPVSRDWKPIAETTAWFTAHPRPVTELIWSQSYGDVLLKRDPTENPLRYGDRAFALASFANARRGTLVMWDADVGPSSYGLSGRDIEQTGFVAIHQAAYTLSGWLPPDSSSSLLARVRGLLRLPPSQLRHQEMWLLYRP